MAKSGGRENLVDFAILITVLVFYILIMPKTLSPYRDAGEMALDIFTISISHQPGYSLYNLVGVLFSFLWKGEPAYGLNILSAIFGSIAIFFINKSLRMITQQTLLSIFVSLLFAVNFTVITISSVSEMYSLNLLLASFLIYFFLKNFIYSEPNDSKILLFSYLAGLFATNRTDIILTYPGFIYVAVKYLDKYLNFKTVIKSFFMFLAGFSLCLYVYFLSKSSPLINWSNPCDLSSLMAMITRKNYGSTLDLISLNYKMGENLIVNMIEYLKHLLKNFNVLLFFFFYGIYISFKSKKEIFYLFILIFFFAGPLFLFIANMPPNPHSMAIVEPYYVIPDISVLFFSIIGLSNFKMSLRISSLAIIISLYSNYPYLDRHSLNITDLYANDILDSIPENSIVISKKDVPLFTLWYNRYVKNKRPDIEIVAQGLTGSKWYRDSKINKNIKIIKLNEEKENWILFKKINERRVFATYDVQLPPGIKTKPNGLTFEIEPSDNSLDIKNLIKIANIDIKKPYNDFFVKDMAKDYSFSITEYVSNLIGYDLISENLLEFNSKALILDEFNYKAYFNNGLIHSLHKQWEKALREFEKAKNTIESMIILEKKYKTGEENIKYLKNQLSYAILNIGVCMEKMGKRDIAGDYYLKAVETDPNSFHAHYNLAAYYWNKDIKKAEEEFKKAVGINPYNPDAVRYLKLISNLK